MIELNPRVVEISIKGTQYIAILLSISLLLILSFLLSELDKELLSISLAEIQDIDKIIRKINEIEIIIFLIQIPPWLL